jgi:hypothetical protein
MPLQAAGGRRNGDRRPQRGPLVRAKLGHASCAQGDNAFGVTDDLNLVTVERSRNGTIVTWEEYYQAADLAMMRAEYDSAFADIAERLIARFGGRVIERTVDGPQ